MTLYKPSWSSDQYQQRVYYVALSDRESGLCCSYPARETRSHHVYRLKGKALYIYKRGLQLTVLGFLKQCETDSQPVSLLHYDLAKSYSTGYVYGTKTKSRNVEYVTLAYFVPSAAGRVAVARAGMTIGVAVLGALAVFLS